MSIDHERAKVARRISPFSGFSGLLCWFCGRDKPLRDGESGIAAVFGSAQSRSFENGERRTDSETHRAVDQVVAPLPRFLFLLAARVTVREKEKGARRPASKPFNLRFVFQARPGPDASSLVCAFGRIRLRSAGLFMSQSSAVQMKACLGQIGSVCYRSFILTPPPTTTARLYQFYTVVLCG